MNGRRLAFQKRFSLIVNHNFGFHVLKKKYSLIPCPLIGTQRQILKLAAHSLSLALKICIEDCSDTRVDNLGFIFYHMFVWSRGGVVRTKVTKLPSFSWLASDLQIDHVYISHN